IGEGVETGRQAPHAGEGTVRLSPKGESDRITQRSAVQIRPPQPRTPLPKCSGVRPFWTLRKSADDVPPRQPYGFGLYSAKKPCNLTRQFLPANIHGAARRQHP